MSSRLPLRRRAVLAAVTAVLVAAGAAAAPPAVAAVSKATVTPTIGPPTTATTLTLAGFGVREAVDVYVDTTAVKLVVTNATGAATVPVAIPASAVPGAHWLTAVGRTSGTAAQVSFTVRTNQTLASFDNARTGTNPYENVITPTTVAGLRQQWRVPLPGSINETPAVVNGVVYVAVGDGTIHAYNAGTGAQKWSTATGGGTSFSAPAISGSTLYAGSSDHKLYALSTSTGAVKWSAPTGDVVYSSPVVVGTTVYVGSYDKRLYAFDAATGAVKWSFLTGGAVFTPPSVVGGLVFTGSFDGSVYALNAATGAQVWSYATAGLVLAPTATADGLVFAASEGGDVVALRARDGSVRWNNTGGALADALGYVSGSVIVPDANGVVRAYDSATGSLLWARQTPGPATVLRATVASAGGVVYVGYDSTFALQVSNGAPLRTLPAGAHYGGAAVVDGTVTVGDSTSQELVRYALPAGAGGSGAARPVPGALRP